MSFQTKLAHAIRGAFTLLELITTVAIIAILAALLLPAFQNAYGKAKRIACGSNLRNVGVAFHSWAHDHNDLFPMQVSTSASGTREFAEAVALNPDVSLTFRHFQAISNELASPELLACPADDRRSRAANFASLGNENVSYWINPAAAFGRADSPLAGDRNVRTSGRTEWTFIRFGPSDGVEFSAELHGHRGNVLFGDAHVDVFDSGTLDRAFVSSNGADLTLSIPRPEITAVAGNGGSSDVGTNWSVFNGGTASVASGESSLASKALQAANSVSGSVTKSANPAASANLNRRDGASGAGANEVVVVARLDGTMVTSSVPGRATNTISGTGTGVNSGEDVPANPIVAFAQWLTHTSARGAYWLLFLLLVTLIAFEVARRRGQRKRKRRRSWP